MRWYATVKQMAGSDKGAAQTGEVTRALRELSQGGDPDSNGRLFGLVYEEFRALAHSYFRSQPANHTLQPTAVVHEAFVKLVDRDASSYNDRNHFFAVGALVMRQILVNHAVAKGAKKRGGEARKLQLDEAAVFQPERDEDVLIVDEMLKELSSLNEKHARIVEMRFFGGLSIAEVADVMGVSTRTIDREWRMCRAWMRNYLESA